MPRLRRLPAYLLLAVAPTLAIHGFGSAPATGQDDRLSAGEELYVVSCSMCHGPAGEGTPLGPPVVGAGEALVSFVLSTGRMPIADPHERPRRGPPAFDPDGIEAIVTWVASLGPGGEPIPQVDPARGDLARGRALYAANCLACHGPGGQGAAVGGGQVAPSLHPATAREVAEAIRAGPGAMPPFGDEVLDQADLDSVVRYVVALREQEDPGGFGLGHIGPVAEGFVAVVVGMGLLLLVIRFTGTRT